MCHETNFIDIADHAIRAGSFIIIVALILFRDRIFPRKPHG